MLSNFRCATPRLYRTFFSPPSFSLFKTDADVQRYSERKVLPYSAKQLFDVVANVSRYPKFIPFCTECRVLSSSPVQAQDGSRKMEVELTAGFLSFKESYVSEVTCTPFKTVEAVAKSSTPLFTSLSTTWRFQPTSSTPSKMVSGKDNSGETLVTFDLAYAFSNPIHAAVSSAFFSQVSKQTIAAFENRCAEVYGPQGKG